MTLEWTPEREDWLRRLWAEGHAGSRIAEMMGFRTRNPILGKAHRMGLPKRYNAKQPRLAADRRKHRRREQSPRAADVEAKAKRPPAPAVRPHRPPPTPSVKTPIVQLTEPPSLKVPFISATTNQCRFIRGDVRLGGATFCGHPVEAHMFCQYHRRLCYHTVDERRRERDAKRLAGWMAR
jgi:GcrA cell cycle regulator